MDKEELIALNIILLFDQEHESVYMSILYCNNSLCLFSMNINNCFKCGYCIVGNLTYFFYGFMFRIFEILF